MEVEKFVVKKIISSSPEDKVSKALSLMEANQVHQLPVMEGSSVCGMIFLRDIVLEDMDVGNTNIRTVMRKNIPSLDISMDELEAMRIILDSGVRALPVCKDSKLFGVLSETDLLGRVKENITAESLMSEPVTVEEEDNIPKAKQLMREHNISRLPVIDANGNLTGVIDTMDLIRATNPKDKSAKSFEPSTRVMVKSIMREPFLLSRKSNTSDIVKALVSNEEAIVAEGKKLLGIITPKDMLELTIPKQENRIQISHLSRDDILSKNIIYESIEKWLKKHDIEADYVFIYVHAHHSSGRIKYSLNMRMRSSAGLLIVKAVEWDLLSCVQDLTKKAQKIMDKRHGKLIDKKRKRN
jgi:predicted transcriptional regulator